MGIAQNNLILKFTCQQTINIVHVMILTVHQTQQLIYLDKELVHRWRAPSAGCQKTRHRTLWRTFHKQWLLELSTLQGNVSLKYKKLFWVCTEQMNSQGLPYLVPQKHGSITRPPPDQIYVTTWYSTWNEF